MKPNELSYPDVDRNWSTSFFSDAENLYTRLIFNSCFFSILEIVYSCSDLLIKCFRRFWEVVFGFNLSLKKKLLLFTTGSDRVPVGGMSEMHFKITRMDGANVDRM